MASPHLVVSDPAPMSVLVSQEIVSMKTSRDKNADNLFLCLEEVNYQDESDDDTLKDENLPCSQCQSQLVVVSDIGPSSSPTQFCSNFGPSTPSASVLFSPNTPWLTTSSPQITNLFTTNFSSPLQPLEPQTTPKLHHPPPISSPSLYSPCISFSSSLPAYNFEVGQGDLQWISGDSIIHP